VSNGKTYDTPYRCLQKPEKFNIPLYLLIINLLYPERSDLTTLLFRGGNGSTYDTKWGGPKPCRNGYTSPK